MKIEIFLLHLKFIQKSSRTFQKPFSFSKGAMGAMGAIEAFFLFQMKKLHCAEKPKPMAVFTMESPVRFGSNNRTSGSVRFRTAMLWFLHGTTNSPHYCLLVMLGSPSVIFSGSCHTFNIIFMLDSPFITLFSCFLRIPSTPCCTLSSCWVPAPSSPRLGSKFLDLLPKMSPNS